MSDPVKQKLSRRRMVAGVGTAGALAAAAALVPGRGKQPAAETAAAPVPAPAAEEGYRLSEHVLRYYQTTRV